MNTAPNSQALGVFIMPIFVFLALADVKDSRLVVDVTT